MPRRKLWRLTESFIEGDGKQIFGYGGRREFIVWEDRQEPDPENPRRKVAARYFGKLRSGEPVPDDVINVFSEYLHFQGLERHRISQIAMPAEADEKLGGLHTTRLAIDRMTWSERLTTILSPITLPSEARCRTKSDFLDAAEIVIHSVARHDGTGLSGDHALKYGERVMHRSKEEYAKWLERLCDANENAVLFAVQHAQRRLIRVGVSVAAALTGAAYARFRNGEIEDMDIGKKDLVPRGRSLFVDAVAENDEFDLRQGKTQRSVDLNHTVFNQLALLCPPIDLKENRVRVITFARTKKNEKRMQRTDFQELESTTSRTGKRIFECAWPESASDAEALTAHVSMLCVIGFYQIVIGMSEN